MKTRKNYEKLAQDFMYKKDWISALHNWIKALDMKRESSCLQNNYIRDNMLDCVKNLKP